MARRPIYVHIHVTDAWQESEHPRRDDGKFGHGSGGKQHEQHEHPKLGKVEISVEGTEGGFRGVGTHAAGKSVGVVRATEEEALADMRKAFRVGKPTARPAPALSAGTETSTASIFGNAAVPSPTVEFQEPVVKKVDAAKLLPTQGTVLNSIVGDYRSGDKGQHGGYAGRLPEVVLGENGEHILVDGHHLAAAQIIKGTTSLRVAVVGRVKK